MSISSAMGRALREIKGGPLDAQIRKSQQKGFPGPQIKSYLLEKYDWTEEYLEDISEDIEGFKKKHPQYFI